MNVNLSGKHLAEPGLVEQLGRDAAAHRRLARDPAARDHREPAARPRSRHPGHARAPARARHQARDRRLRHRLLVAQLPLSPPDRRGEARSLVRPGSRGVPGARGRGSHGRQARSRAVARRRRRRRRDDRRARSPAPLRLRHGTGLLLLPAHRGGGRQSAWSSRRSRCSTGRRCPSGRGTNAGGCSSRHCSPARADRPRAGFGAGTTAAVRPPSWISCCLSRSPRWAAAASPSLLRRPSLRSARCSSFSASASMRSVDPPSWQPSRSGHGARSTSSPTTETAGSKRETASGARSAAPPRA